MKLIEKREISKWNDINQNAISSEMLILCKNLENHKRPKKNPFRFSNINGNITEKCGILKIYINFEQNYNGLFLEYLDINNNSDKEKVPRCFSFSNNSVSKHYFKKLIKWTSYYDRIDSTILDPPLLINTITNVR